MSASRPDLAFDIARPSQVNVDGFDKKDISKINKIISAIKEEEIPLNYCHMYKDYMYVVGYVDNGFANNADQNSQLGMFVLMKDKYDNAAIIYFS